MPLRTRVFTTVLERLGRESIIGMDLEGIQAGRQGVPPSFPPFTWVTGPVFADVQRQDTSFPARDGHQVPLRVYRPAASSGPPEPLPVIVYFHGGGWVLGNTRMYDPLCTFLARAVGAVVVSVDYRLAPEHRAPQAVLDSVDSLRWLAARADSLGGVGGEATQLAACGDSTGDGSPPLAVCGDSAGGNLAAIVCQVVRDEGGPAIAHQGLLYPATDATMSQPSILEKANAPILTRAKIEVFRNHYLGPDGLAASDPLVSPLWAVSHADLPPALIQTADLDPLRDEGRLYAERLAATGVPVRYTNYLGVPHGFASFPGATTIGRRHRAELVDELRRHLHP